MCKHPHDVTGDLPFISTLCANGYTNILGMKELTFPYSLTSSSQVQIQLRNNPRIKNLEHDNVCS